MNDCAKICLNICIMGFILQKNIIPFYIESKKGTCFQIILQLQMQCEAPLGMCVYLYEYV